MNWLVELPQTDLGTWPVKSFPARLDRSPAYTGGILGRSNPNYDEDTGRVLSSAAELRGAGVV